MLFYGVIYGWAKSYAKNVENFRRRKTAPTCAQRAQRLFAAAAQLIGK